jgi:hypothetical protein
MGFRAAFIQLATIWRSSFSLRRGGALTAVGAFAIVTGCAGGPWLTGNSSAEEKATQVRERVDARWRALIAGDMERAYSYLSPASREITTLELYKARVKPGMYRDVKIDSVSCEREVCVVRLLLTYDHRLMKGITTPVEESWVLEKGRFWYVYRG